MLVCFRQAATDACCHCTNKQHRTMATSMLEQPLRDLCREVIDLRRSDNRLETYDLKKLHALLTVSKDSLTETSLFQQQLLQQLHQFDTALKDINQILRINAQERIALEQQPQLDDDLRAQLMLLNAEALECRAVAVQLQQKSRVISSKTIEVEKRALDQLTAQANEMKKGPASTEQNHTGALTTSKSSGNNEPLSKDPPSQALERLLSPMKIHPTDEECNQWPIREFMHDDRSPPCLLKMSSQSLSMPVEIAHVPVVETEYLLDYQEELIGTPLKVQFDSSTNDRTFIILAIPYIVKRTTHREHVIKIRQANDLWLAVESIESQFDAHKDKRFVQCQLCEPSVCAVVSRLKRDHIAIDKHSAGRFSSSADARFTMQWSEHLAQTSFSLNARLQPVDLPFFTQFCRDFTYECQGLLAVGPIIELHFDDIPLLKPMQFTFPMLVPPKKSTQTVKSSTNESNTSQQQQSLFQSILTEDTKQEKLILLYTGLHDNTWHIDADAHLVDSKTHDTISTEMQSLHSRMLVVRYDQQLMSKKQLQTAISLLEETLDQRSVFLVLRSHDQNPRGVCLVCCSDQCRETVENNLQQENYSIDLERPKEIILQEGQLLEIRFRGNVQPIATQQRTATFAFNTHFPFYFETEIGEIDRYAQHLSSYFYGFLQVFSKPTVVRHVSKALEKKGHSADTGKQELQESDLCAIELLLRLPKPSNEVRAPIQKALVTFTGEGILTPTLFRDLSTSLTGDEWRRLARRLGMTRIRIEAIEHDYLTDTSYYMLLTWFKRVSRASDKVLLLIHALKMINRKDLAQDLQSIKEDRRYEQQTMSKEEQLRVLTVAFNRICQREECLRIWKQLARELTLTNEDIHQIEQAYSSRQERCLRCLEHWATNEPRADVLCLAKIIRTLGFKPLARELETMV